MRNWKKLICVMLCLGVFTLNAQENELPAAEEVKTANKEADKKDAKKLREEKKIEAAITNLKKKIDKAEAEFQAKKKELADTESELTAIEQARKTPEGDTEENKTKSVELSAKREKLNEEAVKLSEKRNNFARELAEVMRRKETAEKAEERHVLQDKYKKDFELLDQLKKQEKEKKERLIAERKSLQKQLSEVRLKIRERTAAINQGNLRIKEISDKIILSVSTEEDKKLLAEKSSFVLQRTHIEKELDALKRSERTLVAKLAEKDEGYELADGTLNWSKVYDIETFQRVKPGTWHLSVIAKDSNNNQNKPVEINIKIDSKSDIPTINVINPKPKSRVPGNLMIVGTAYDDDAVSKVTFTLDSELEERVCNGTDFWNYDLDTTGLEDGNHKLTFRVTDVNGVKCKPYVVPFVLDRKVPTITLPSMVSGTVVSEKCKVSGFAEDLNGIAGIYYSVDGRYSYSKIASGFGKKKCSWSFNLDVAKELGVGTNIVWIKAVDNAGSEGFFPLTLIVDREAPDVGFHYPHPDSKVGTRFELFGYAYDNVEIKKLAVKISSLGFATPEMPVIFKKGNAMWNFPVNLKELSGDSSKVKNGKLEAEIIVTDVANNIVRKKLSLMVDNNVDNSIITLKSVKSGDRFGDEIPVFGAISSAHNVKSALINLYNDKNELVIGNDVAAEYSLSTSLDVSELPEGSYILEVIAKNESMQYEPIRVEVGIDRSCPQFNINELAEKYVKNSFSKKLDIGFSVKKTGTIKKATYALTNIDGTILSQGDLKVKSSNNNLHQMQPVALDVSDSKVYDGIKLLSFSALDDTLKNTEITVPVIIDNTQPVITDVVYDKNTGLMEDVVVTVSDNLLLSNVEIIETSSANTTPNKINIAGNRDFQFPMKVKDDAGSFISYNYEIKAVDVCGSQTVKNIKVQFKNTTAENHTLTIKVAQKDRSQLMGKAGLFLKSKRINPDSINGGFGFVNGDVKSVSISTDNGVAIEPAIINEALGIFSFELLSNDIRKNFVIGDNRIVFSDAAGTLDELVCLNDLLMPRAKTIWPPACISFNSNITVYGVATDDSGIAAVTASLDSLNAEDFKPVSIEPIENIMNKSVAVMTPHLRDKTQTIGEFLNESKEEVYKKGVMYSFNFPTDDLKEGEHTVYFKVEDRAGKTTSANILITVDRTAPNAKLLAPEEFLRTNGTITLRGEAEDEFGIGSAVAVLDGKKIVGNGKNIWNILYDLYERSEFNREDAMQILPMDINIDVFDMAGNKSSIVSKVVLDVKNDVPEIIINSPAVDNQRYTTDAIRFDGVVFDDDGIDSLQYRLDFGMNDEGATKSEEDGWKSVILKENELPNWSVTMVPGYLAPGKHTLELRAFDKNFVQSEVKSVTFQIDLENPVITVIGPENGEYIKGTRLVNGKAYDPNGIASVNVSTNNGWTFVPAEGGENWMFYLDSKTLPDGDLKFLIRAEDEVGSSSYSFALFNIDNTPPEVSILLPTDGMSINNQYTFIGRAKDNIALSKGSICITSESKNMFEGDSRCDEDGYIELTGLEAWTFDLDVSEWSFGKYHAAVKFSDMAGNITEKSFDFFVEPRSDFPVVELDQPQSGQHLTGNVIEFYGTAYDDDGIDAVYLQIDNHPRVKAEGTKQWRYLEPSINLEPGLHKVVVVAQEKSPDPNKKGKYSMSISRNFYVDESGIIINVTSNLNGDSIGYRPWFSGTAEFYERNLEMKMKRELQEKKYHDLLKQNRDNPELVPAMEEIAVTKFEVDSAMSKYIAANKIKAIYMSSDNGNSYKKNFGTPEEWKVRLQTQYMKNGTHMLQFKAVTASGKETLKYFKVNLDREVPTVVIDAPEENTRLNGAIVVHGYANDNNDLEEVKVRLKRYDKNLGKMPKFIDGIYLWAQAFGGPIVSGGFGFSFFDNIVRLEGAFGWVPSESNLKDIGLEPGNAFYDTMFTPELGWINYRYEPRFPGFVAGGKLLAQVLDLPFEFFFGEDASNFSISLEIGAGFYWFSGFAGASDEINGTYYKTKHQNEGKGNEGYNPSIDGRVLAGFMYQLDFFKVHDYKFLKDFALYFENSFYFVASEVDSRLVPQFGFGLRNSIVTNKDK